MFQLNYTHCANTYILSFNMGLRGEKESSKLQIDENHTAFTMLREAERDRLVSEVVLDYDGIEDSDMDKH